MPPSSRAGGEPPSGRSLSFAEREESRSGARNGTGVREIARRLGRAPSTIPRLRRNAATRSGGLAYRATTAQWHVDFRPPPEGCEAAINAALLRYVQYRLAARIDRPEWAAVCAARRAVEPPTCMVNGRNPTGPATAWSPNKSTAPPLDFPDDETMRISRRSH